MAAVHEQQLGHRRRRTRQMDGRRSQFKVCQVCHCQTRWLSVDGMCWKCTVTMAKKKAPIYIESEEEEGTGTFFPDSLL